MSSASSFQEPIHCDFLNGKERFIMKQGQQPLVSVIIPVFNGEETLHRCLEALRQSTYGNVEIIVSDDASTDGSLSIAEAFPVTAISSPHDRPSGAAAARNRAAHKAQGEILFFTDADVVVLPETIDSMVTLFQKRPDIHAVIGSYTRETPISNFCSRFKNYLHHFTHQQSNEDAITFWTACGGILRSVFLELGGFNENYQTASVEDIAFGYLVTRKGYRIFLAKDVQVTHLKRYSLRSLVISDMFYRAIPWTRLMLRERTFRSDLNTSFSSAIGLLAAYLLVPTAIASLFHCVFLIACILSCSVFIAVNSPLYRRIYHAAGSIFMVRFVLMSFFYYLYSGLGFLIAVIGFVFNQRY